MRTIEAQDAETRFSAIVDAAERGEPTTIVRNGRPSAIVVPVASTERVQGIQRPNFGIFLMSFPIVMDDDRSAFRGLRDADL